MQHLNRLESLSLANFFLLLLLNKEPNDVHFQQHIKLLPIFEQQQQYMQKQNINIKKEAMKNANKT
jgi:hypothetical protein